MLITKLIVQSIFVRLMNMIIPKDSIDVNMLNNAEVKGHVAPVVGAKVKIFVAIFIHVTLTKLK